MEPGRRLEVDVWPGAVPAVLFALAIVAALDSPRRSLKVGRMDEGQDVLARINGKAIASDEAVSICESLTAEEGRLSELFTSGFVLRFFIGVVLAGLTQTSRNNPGLFVSPFHFQAAGTNTGTHFPSRCW